MTSLPNLTHYDLLDVSADADPADVREAYLRISRELAAAKGRAGADYRLERLRHAYKVLSSPALKAEYDASLLAHGVLPSMPLRVELGLPEARWSPLRKLLTVIATLMVAGMVVQLAVFGMSYHRVKTATSPEAMEQAADKVYLQDFYQTYGVRMATKAEAEAYLAELKAKETADREVAARERAKTDQERKQRQFEEESRRIGADVSARLRSEEEHAAQLQERERRAKEEAIRATEEAERARIERQQESWRAVLNR
jgi:curved DNA-binding protein CbpA